MFYMGIVLLGIGLSIDAFSLAISVSLSNLKNYKPIMYSFFVAVFHFFMPLIGYLFQSVIKKLVIIPNKLLFIGAIVYIIIGIILDKDDDEPIINPILFSFIVSIDSFSIGISLCSNDIIKSCICFSVISCIFTYLGFKFGAKLKSIINKKRKVLSVFILLVVLVYKLLT